MRLGLLRTAYTPNASVCLLGACTLEFPLACWTPLCARYCRFGLAHGRLTLAVVLLDVTSTLDIATSDRTAVRATS